MQTKLIMDLISINRLQSGFFFFEINNTIKGVIMKMENYKMEIHTKGVIVCIIIHMN